MERPASPRSSRPAGDGLSGEVEEKDFGLVDTAQFERLLTGDSGAVAGFELLAIERDRAAGHLDIGVPVGPEFVLDDFARSEDGGIQFVVLADFHGAVAAVGRGNQAQLAALFGFGEVLLVVDRLVALLVGEHPDLVEVHGFLLGSVELAMRHAGARAHVLHVAWTNDRAVTHAVFVSEGTLENISDDFHILVRMSWEAATARDAVVVHHAQGAELHVFQVKIVGEGKGEAGVEPAVVGMAAVVAFANGDHRRTSSESSLRNNSRYNDNCQEVYLAALAQALSPSNSISSTAARALRRDQRFRKAPLRLKAKLFPLNPVCYPS